MLLVGQPKCQILAPAINSHSVADPTICLPCFDLSQQQWFLLNRFYSAQLGHCGTGRKRERLIGSCGRDPDDVSHYRLVRFDEAG